MWTSLLVCLLIDLSFYCPSYGVKYYVKPTHSSKPSTDCPSDRGCYTLNQYAQNYTSHFTSQSDNATLVLLTGFHFLEFQFKISNVNNVTITAANTSVVGNVRLLLWRDIMVSNVSYIDIENIHIIGVTGKVSRNKYASLKVVTSKSILFYQVMIAQIIVVVNTRNLALVKSYYKYSPVTYSKPTSVGLFVALNSVFQESPLYLCSPDYTCSSNSVLNVRFVNCQITVVGTTSIAVSSHIKEGYLYISILATYCYSRYCFELETNQGASMFVTALNSVFSGSIFLGTFHGSNAIIIAAFKLCNFTRSSTPILITHYGSIRINSASRYSQINLIVEDCKFSQRIYATVASSIVFSLSLTRCVFTETENSLIRTRVYVPELSSARYLGNTSVEIILDECRVTYKRGEESLLGFYVDTYSQLMFNLIIKNTLLMSNSVKALLVSTKRSRPDNGHRQLATSVLLNNVSFFENSDLPSRENSAIFEAAYVDNITLHNCVFQGNTETPVLAYFSDLTLSGTTLFKDNSGYRGGAISLHFTYLYLNYLVQVTFERNYAQDVGGAIYIRMLLHTSLIDPNSRCFYHFKTNYFHHNVSVEFFNNTALNGGESIYGGPLRSSCRVNYLDHTASSSNVIEKHNPFSLNKTSFSAVSSNPKRICLCNEQGKPQCLNLDYIYPTTQFRYPGETFTILAVIVGYEFGTLAALVYSQLVNGHKFRNSRLGYKQHIQEISNYQRCTHLEYSIESQDMDTHVLALTTYPGMVQEYGNRSLTENSIKEFRHRNIIVEHLLTTPVYVNVTLQNCPSGFILSNLSPYVCKCHPKLEKNSINTCVIINHTGWIYRSGTTWISDTLSGNESNRTDNFVVHNFCPYNYCKSQNVSVDLTWPDKQCTNNHSGVLCGGCQGNLSLAIGSSRCLQCSNSYMSLLIVFLLAGIALVFFIKILDLTVSRGTTNGLILYANVIWTNRSVLFPNTEQSHPTVWNVFEVFIAWINLDFGIETCFINGLDAYWKTMLQFTFPLYIWSIIVVIIISSKYFIVAGKLFGNNSVPVLATLFLLSYAKLLRTIIISVGFSLLYYPDRVKMVWSLDGNVPYFGVAHSILLMIALAVLLMLWLPYTIVLLFIQCLRRKAHLRLLQWVNRWKPFFDAYHGQLKPKHSYWIGISLLVRLILFTLFAGTSAVVPQINILAIMIVGVIQLGYTSVTGSVYKRQYLSLLENSFTVNLIVLAGGVLYTDAIKGDKTPLIYTSVSIAFVKFVSIIVYHIWIRMKTAFTTYKRRRRDLNVHTNNELRNIEPAHNHLHYRRYRESLLDSTSRY